MEEELKNLFIFNFNLKKFLFHTALFSGILLASIFAVFFIADGTTDASYLKFTSSKQTSLIIGASRASQGLQPSILNDQLNRKDIYNYAFTLMSSPYGESYYRSIKSKFEASNRGIFILEVSPWTLSKTIDLENKNEYKPELMLQTFVSNTQIVNLNPNVEYLVESYNERYLNIIVNKFKKDKIKNIKVHADGWLKVEINDSILDKKNRVKRKLKNYSTYLNYYIPNSKYRMNYLRKAISLLSLKGDVVLVRLPIDQRMMEIENMLWSKFDDDMQKVADSSGIRYYNLTKYNTTFEYTDGNHLTIESSAKVSKLLAKLISDNK